MRSFSRVSFCAIAASLVFSAAAPGFAKGRDPGFFIEEAYVPKVETRAAKPIVKPRPRAHLKGQRKLAMKPGSLLQPRISLDLNGENVLAVRDRIDRARDGTVSWIGHIAGSPDNLVVLTGHRGGFAGRIDYDGRAFEISREAGGAMMIGELDPAALPQEEPFFLPDGAAASEPIAFKGAPAVALDEIRQDLLVAYTDDACVANGGDGVSDCDQIEAQIVNAVADMNAAYAVSDVNITMNLVGMVLTQYDEGSKSISDMLSELRSTSDGQMDEIHDARDAVGADIVALISASGGGFCGVGYVGSSSTYAMSVTAEFCLSNRTLAHEIGHNQGANHARSQSGGGSSGAYNYGYRRCNDGSVDDVGAPYFSTIMAYSCSGAARTGSFSNPNVNANGAPTGVDPADDPDNAAWAARTLNESAAYMADFRDSVSSPPTTTPPTTTPPSTPPAPTPPATPSGLSASVAGDTAIAVSWADNADDEDEYQLQRSVGSGGFSVIATLPAETVSYADNGLNPGTSYRYRVRARNSAGSSSYSNTGEATTTAPPTQTRDLARRDVIRAGGVQGAYYHTHSNDGVIQRITEVASDHVGTSNKYRANHVWEFDILGSGETVFSANAYVSGDEGFHFLYKRSQDKRWRAMFTVNSRSASNVERFTFPAGTSGRVLVRATDAYQGKHETADRLSIDYMAAVSNPSSDQQKPVRVLPPRTPQVLVERKTHWRWRRFRQLPLETRLRD